LKKDENMGILSAAARVLLPIFFLYLFYAIDENGVNMIK